MDGAFGRDGDAPGGLASDFTQSRKKVEENRRKNNRWRFDALKSVTGRLGGKKRIVLPPIEFGLFRVLLVHVGQLVYRPQFRHPYFGHVFEAIKLNAHIAVLRNRLGPRIGKRIRTVIGKGYVYLGPS
jgi:DNA-binding response OmpR family regulator